MLRPDSLLVCGIVFGLAAACQLPDQGSNRGRPSDDDAEPQPDGGDANVDSDPSDPEAEPQPDGGNANADSDPSDPEVEPEPDGGDANADGDPSDPEVEPEPDGGDANADGDPGPGDPGPGPETATEINTLPGNDQVTLTQLPLFKSSSPWSYVTMVGDNRLLYQAETGLYWLDLADPNATWKRVVNFDGVQGINIGGQGVGAVASETGNPDAVYFCSGYGPTSETLIDYRKYLDLGQIYLSTDGFESVTQVAGDEAWERLVLSCPGREYSRYIIEPETGIEMWVLTNRNNLFALDNRESVTRPDGTAISKTVYFLTHMQGLARGIYDSNGTDMSWEIIQGAPIFYDEDRFDNNGSYGGGIFNYALLSQDQFYYQYAPQEGSADERSRYAPDANSTDCNRTIDGLEVHGEWNATEGQCIEIEEHHMAGALALDPVYHKDNTDKGLLNRAILYAGYLVQPIWPFGGLHRVVIDENGSVASDTELTRPGTGEHLDVRDIAVDRQRTTSVAGVGEVARTFYVAAGTQGIFKGDVNPAGSVTLTDVTNNLFTREDYVADYANCGSNGTSCGDTISYQYTAIQQVYWKGKSYLFLGSTVQNTIYWATDDVNSTITWNELEVDGRVHGVAIDLVREKLYHPTTEDGVFSVSLNDLNSSAPTYQSTGNFADRAGFWPIYDPTGNDRVHFADLDGTYGNFSWDANFELVDEVYAASVRVTEIGLCYGMYYAPDPTILDGDGNELLSSSEESALGTKFRLNSYGTRVLTAPLASDPTRSPIYSTANYFGGSDGAIYRGEWNSSVGQYTFRPATGDKGCRALYPYWNASKNTCLYVCDTEDSANALPALEMSQVAIDPNDGDHLMLIGANSGSRYLYETTNGGEDWTNRSSEYVYGSAAGPSMNALGGPTDLVFDPHDGDVLYVAYTYYGVYKYDVGVGYFVDITHPDTSADNNASAMTLGTYTGATFTSLGATQYKVPYLYELDAVADAADTRLYLAVGPFCDQGWGLFPVSECTVTNGGGVYSKLTSETYWQKLNYVGDATNPIQYFMAYSIAASPVDPDTIVAVGYNYFGWGSMGNPGNLSTGVIYSQDGGASWAWATDLPLTSGGVGAHPTDATRFVFSILGWGMWELDLDGL